MSQAITFHFDADMSWARGQRTFSAQADDGTTVYEFYLTQWADDVFTIDVLERREGFFFHEPLLRRDGKEPDNEFTWEEAKARAVAWFRSVAERNAKGEIRDG